MRFRHHYPDAEGQRLQKDLPEFHRIQANPDDLAAQKASNVKTEYQHPAASHSYTDLRTFIYQK
jgi:hypothetical protein